MSITIVCDKCSKRYQVQDNNAGRQAKCTCGHIITVLPIESVTQQPSSQPPLIPPPNDLPRQSNEATVMHISPKESPGSTSRPPPIPPPDVIKAEDNKGNHAYSNRVIVGLIITGLVSIFILMLYITSGLHSHKPQTSSSPNEMITGSSSNNLIIRELVRELDNSTLADAASRELRTYKDETIPYLEEFILDPARSFNGRMQAALLLWGMGTETAAQVLEKCASQLSSSKIKTDLSVGDMCASYAKGCRHSIISNRVPTPEEAAKIQRQEAEEREKAAQEAQRQEKEKQKRLSAEADKLFGAIDVSTRVTFAKSLMQYHPTAEFYGKSTLAIIEPLRSRNWLLLMGSNANPDRPKKEYEEDDIKYYHNWLIQQNVDILIKIGLSHGNSDVRACPLMALRMYSSLVIDLAKDITPHPDGNGWIISRPIVNAEVIIIPATMNNHNHIEDQLLIIQRHINDERDKIKKKREYGELTNEAAITTEMEIVRRAWEDVKKIVMDADKQVSVTMPQRDVTTYESKPDAKASLNPSTPPNEDRRASKVVSSERRVTLTAPYPTVYAGAATDKMSLQYAVMEIAKQANMKYDKGTSYKNTDPLCRRWTTPNIRDVPFSEAMSIILNPVGLRYELHDNTIVLMRK